MSIDNDAYGSAVKSEFEKISAQLSSKYGNSKKYDFLETGSIWNEPKEWAMATFKKERHLIRFWNQEYRSALPPGVSGITLKVNATDSNHTYHILIYEFDNFLRCKAQINSAEGNAL